jgi:homogentisate 1,2-dioxygenase
MLTAVSYDVFKMASEAELGPMRVHEDTIGEYHYVTSFLSSDLMVLWCLAFMFESSMMFTLTDYAMKRSGKLHG